MAVMGWGAVHLVAVLAISMETGPALAPRGFPLFVGGFASLTAVGFAAVVLTPVVGITLLMGWSALDKVHHAMKLVVALGMRAVAAVSLTPPAPRARKVRT